MRELRIRIFSISAGLNRDFFFPRGDMGGVEPLENVDVDVEPL